MKIFAKRKIIFGCDSRGDKQSAYLFRWELFECKWFAIYLHQFQRDDDKSSLHDHPWNFITIPLMYGYNDCTYNGKLDSAGNPDFNKELMKPLTIHYRPSTHVHFVELLEGKKAWTLVIRFKYIRYWGFWRNGIFTIFYDYFKQNGC